MPHSLFHSFPRRTRTSSEELNVGLKTLCSLVDIGLLLVPERITFPAAFPSDEKGQSSGTSIVQLRACFTLLGEAELLSHSAEFGAFAIECEVEALRRLGAVPVFYIPQPTTTGESAGFSVLGNDLVHQVRDVCVLLRELVSLERLLAVVGDEHGRVQLDAAGEVDVDMLRRTLNYLRGQKVSFENLYNYCELVANLFYHADSTRPHGQSELQYYCQREWRIISGFGSDDSLLDRPLKVEEVNSLVSLLPWLNSEIVLRSDRVAPRVSVSRVIDRTHEVPFWHCIKRFIVPDEVFDLARRELSTRGVPSNRIVSIPYREIRALRGDGND